MLAAAAPLRGQTADGPTLEAGGVAADAVLPGDTLATPVRIRAEAPPAGDSLRWALRWDPARLTLASVRLRAAGLRVERDGAPRGVLRGVLGGDDPVTGPVADVVFRADGAAGPAAVVADLRVPPEATPPVSATGLSVCVGRSGTLGDVNDDGATDAVDALLVARRAAGLPVDALAVRRRGDVDRDGRADVRDAQRIARHAVGLPAAGDFDAPAPGGCRADEPVGRLLGTMLRTNDRAPLTGVPLRLLRDGRVTARDTTSATGDYVFDGLPAGDYRVEPVGAELPPVGGFRSQRAHRLTVWPGETATSLDFGYRFLELAAAVVPAGTTVSVGETVSLALELRVGELTLPLGTVRGRLEWPSDRLEPAGAPTAGPGWSLQSRTRDAGELTFAAVAAEGLAGDTVRVLTLPMTVRSTGTAKVRPDLSVLEALEPDTGGTVPLLGEVLIDLRAATLEAGGGAGTR